MNWLRTWLLDVELKKGVQVLVHGAAAVLLAHTAVLQSAGISIGLNQDQLAVALLGFIHTGLNLLARKFPNAKILQAIASPHPAQP